MPGFPSQTERFYVVDITGPMKPRPGYWVGRKARNSPVDATAGGDVDFKPIGDHFETAPDPEEETEETIPEKEPAFADYGDDGALLDKGGLFIDLEKARKPYGHTAYTRRTKTGKMVSVRAKGVRPVGSVLDKYKGKSEDEVEEEIDRQNIEEETDFQPPPLDDERFVRAMTMKFQLVNKNKCHQDDRPLFAYIEAVWKRRHGKQLSKGQWLSGDDLHWMLRTAINNLMPPDQQLSKEEAKLAVLDVLDLWEEDGAIKTRSPGANESMNVWSVKGDAKAVDSFHEGLARFKGVFDFIAADGGLGIQVQAPSLAKSKRWGGLYYPEHVMIDMGDLYRKGWSAFAHEFGHYLDYQKLGAKPSTTQGSTYTDPAMTTLVRHLKALPSYQVKAAEVKSTGGSKFYKYWTSDHEIFARFFNEWFHSKLTDDLRNGLFRKEDGFMTTVPKISYSKGEFDAHKESFAAVSGELEKILSDRNVNWQPSTVSKGGLFIDLEKASKPYGHEAYERRDPRTGKIEHVRQRGVKPNEPAPPVPVKKEDLPVLAERPEPGKRQQIRWAKHMDKEIAISLTGDAAKMDDVDAAIFKIAKRRNARTLRDFTDSLRVYLDEIREKLSPAEFEEFAPDVWRAWLDNGYATAPKGLSELEAPKTVKAKGPDRWKSLKHPGIELPPEYKHRGIIKNATAEEMGWYAMRYLFNENAAMTPDTVFLTNFCQDLAHHAGVKLEPKLALVRAYFAPLKKAWEKRTPPPRKDAKGTIKTPKTHPHAFVIKDGKPVALKCLSPTLLAGRIFTGQKNEDAEAKGYSARNPNRGRWQPAIKPEDILLNGTEFPRGWEGETTTDKSARWFGRVRVPKFVNKQGLMYLWPEHEEGQSEIKWDHVNEFVQNHDKIMERVAHDLKSPNPKLRELATLCVCLDTFHPRVDADDSKVEKDRFGLTTLLKKHLWTEKKGAVHEIHFDFIAKSYDHYHSKRVGGEEGQGPGVVVKPFLAAIDNLNALLANKKGNERIFSVKSDEINEYIQGIAGTDHIHAHHFRHYWANKYLMAELSGDTEEGKRAGWLEQIHGRRKRAGKKWSRAEANRHVAQLLAMIGKKLGHRVRHTVSAKTGKTGASGTATVRHSYLHPTLLKQMFKAVGYDLRDKAERRSSMFADLDEAGLMKSLDRMEYGPVYEDHYPGYSPWSDDLMYLFAGAWDSPPEVTE